MAWAGHYTRHIGHTTKTAQDHFPWEVVVSFILIAAVLNKLMEKFRPQAVLTRPELLVIFGMGLIASALPSYFMGHLIANVAAPYYFANAENRWAEDLHPHLPTWAVVADRTAVRWFFEGLPAGAKIPWGVWIVPLFWRLSLVGATGIFGLCAASILRKQWVEHERLSFPLMTLPMAMVERQPEGFFPVGFMNRPIFWVGFALASFPIYWNMVGYFVPLFPQIPSEFDLLSFGRHFPPIHTRLYSVIVGVSYFVDLDVMSSILAFHLLLTLEMGFLNRLGADVGAHDWDGSSFENWQGFGALCVIVLWGLWTARGHLRNVFRRAFWNTPSVDEGGEILSCRAAVFGLMGSGLFIGGWCVASGISVLATAVFLLLVVLIWLGITRMAVEGGMISTRTIQAQFVTYYLVGLTNISPAGLAGFALTETWHHDIKTILMADLGNALRLFEGFRAERRRLLLAISLAMGVVVLGGAYYQVASSYETGAFNYGGIYGPYVQATFDTAAGHIRDPFSLKREQIFWSLLGVGVTALTMGLRYALPWWPLHPLGFAAATAYPVNRIVLSTFVAWFAKLSILRTGGILLYRRAAPLFYGLIVGYFVGVGVSFAVDCIWFPGQGHSLALY
jgi:hypothetical protein